MSAVHEYDALRMDMVYDALRVLQETPWVVNRKVLAVAHPLGRHNLGPQWGSGHLRDATAAKGLSNLTLRFPHHLDSEGHITGPVSRSFDPQGSDLTRGLLTFAKGVPILEANGGADWLAIQLATSWGQGVDRVPFNDRIRWVHGRRDVWLAIAANPTANDQWSHAAKPWQCLAAIFEWAGWLTEGEGFVSTMPVTLDAKSGAEGVAPKFLRSLDAAALVDCVIEAHSRGIKSLAIRDAYGTHAGNMWALYAILRDAFLETRRRRRVAGTIDKTGSDGPDGGELPLL